MKTAVAIINSKASRAAKWVDQLEKLIGSTKVDLKRFELIDDPSRLKKMVKELLKQKPEIIFVGGGDGTIISVIDLAQNNGFKGDFYLIPVGTANYLARNLSVELDIKKNLSGFKGCKSHKVQLSKVNGKYFSLMATMGVATDISADDDVKNKQALGQVAYLQSAVKNLFSAHTFDYTVKANGKTHKGSTKQIVVANARLDDQVKIVPDISITSPKMKITIFESNRSSLKLLGSLLVYVLTLGKIKFGLKTIVATEAEVTTKPKRDISVDGEIITKTPAKFTTADSVNILY